MSIVLKKVFDTINHELFLEKLYSYEIKNNELKWLKDYLNNRKQAVGF